MQKTIKQVVTFSKIVPGGQALGELENGKKVFAFGALAGETAEVTLTKIKSHYVEGVVDNILNPSPDRIEPKDACYLSTSPWQIMTEAAETNLKLDLLNEVFQQHNINFTAKEIAGDNNFYYYRNKMEYSLYWDNEQQKIYPAFHQRGTHRKLPIEHSSIEKPEIWAEVERIIDELNDKKEQARDYQSIVVRANQAGQVSSGVLKKFNPHPKMALLADQIMGRTFSYSPNGFFQINLPVYEMALIDIKNFIDNTSIVDMYAGVGSIGLSVASDRSELKLIETNKDAFGELENNLRLNPTLKAQAILAKAEEALDYIEAESSLIVDPPRAGLDKKVINRIIEVKPRQVAYLSCNPMTQARDIAHLLGDYQIQTLKAFNFFPRTPHIESLCLMTRKS